MKNYLLLVAFICLSQTLPAQSERKCRCYPGEKPDDYFYHTQGNMTAFIGKAIVPLSHGTEIEPEMGTAIKFNIVNTPEIKTTCKNVYSIKVFDEKERKEVYHSDSESQTSFNYTFPKCDRDYTVTMTVHAKIKVENQDPQFLRDQDCQRVMVAIVHPKCKAATLNKTLPLKKN